MSHRWAALVLVLALCAMTPRHAAGQGSPPRGHSVTGKIGQNYPNPYNPETTIPFSLEGCTDGSETHAVTFKILNVLTQVVAIPKFAGPQATSTVVVSPALQGQLMTNLRLPCGAFKAFWDGNYQNTGREAASGIYIAQWFIDGKAQKPIRMFNAK